VAKLLLEGGGDHLLLESGDSLLLESLLGGAPEGTLGVTLDALTLAGTGTVTSPSSVRVTLDAIELALQQDPTLRVTLAAIELAFYDTSFFIPNVRVTLEALELALQQDPRLRVTVAGVEVALVDPSFAGAARAFPPLLTGWNP
jgi:hypothetical protein